MMTGKEDLVCQSCSKLDVYVCHGFVILLSWSICLQRLSSDAVGVLLGKMRRNPKNLCLQKACYLIAAQTPKQELLHTMTQDCMYLTRDEWASEE